MVACRFGNTPGRSDKGRRCSYSRRRDRAARRLHRDGPDKSYRGFDHPATPSSGREGTPIALEQGVLFTTYATLRSDAREERVSRVKQIVDWLGHDFDGVVVF